MNPIDYSKAQNLIKSYKNKFYSSFTQEQKDLYGEFANNLNDLDEISKEIVAFISQLIPEKDFAPDQDDVITFGPFKIPLQRADPKIPIKLDNVTVPYERGGMSFIKTNKELEGKLERQSREFYRIAHRMIKIAESLPKLNSFKSKSISIIRNHLIEHPEGKASGITYDTFAYSLTEGPYIKGLRRGGQTAHMDEGFKANCKELILNLTQVLENAINNK